MKYLPSFSTGYNFPSGDDCRGPHVAQLVQNMPFHQNCEDCKRGNNFQLFLLSVLNLQFPRYYFANYSGTFTVVFAKGIVFQ